MKKPLKDASAGKKKAGQARLRSAVLSQIREAVVGLDDGFRVTFWNPAAERLYGLKAKQALGQRFQELVKNEWQEPIDRLDFMNSLKKSGHWYGESIHYMQDGQAILVESSVSALTDSSGTVTGYLGIIRETGARKKAETEKQRLLSEVNEQREAAKISETKYKVLFDLLPLGITISDKDGNIIESNREGDRLLGLHREDHLGRKIDGQEWQLIRHDGSPMPVEEYASVRAIKENRLIQGVEMGLVRGGGEVTWINVNATPIPLENYGLAITYTDISKRKRAEEELRKAYDELERRVLERTLELTESNRALQAEVASRMLAEAAVRAERQQFNDVLETLPAYLVLLAPDYHVPFANRFFRERFGESGGKRCFEYLFGRGEPCENCETYNALKNMKPHQWEWNGPDGRNYYVYDFPFVNTDGSTLIMEMGIDITEQKRAQEALRKAHDELEQRVRERTRELQESEAGFRSLFTSMTEGFALHEIVCDDQGKPCDYRFLEINPSFERLTGLKRENVVGRLLSQVLPHENRAWVEKYGEVALSGNSMHFEDHSFVLDRDYEVFAYSPAPRQFAVLFIDITERKKLDQLKDDFIGMVSHELRTPLTVIIGALDTLYQHGTKLAKSEVSQLLNDAISESEELAHILDNLLELSRSQAHRLKIAYRKVDLVDLTHKVVRKLERDHDHRFVVGIDDLPLVEVDALRIERVIFNLLQNAVKYSPPDGLITISAGRQDGEILFKISDKGIGISPADQAKLFNPFQRIEAEEKGLAKGIGLGLIVCRRLVEAHGGRIWLESEEGKGTTVFFTLPLKAEA